MMMIIMVIIHSDQPPEWPVLTHLNCFNQREQDTLKYSDALKQYCTIYFCAILTFFSQALYVYHRTQLSCNFFRPFKAAVLPEYFSLSCCVQSLLTLLEYRVSE